MASSLMAKAAAPPPADGSPAGDGDDGSTGINPDDVETPYEPIDPHPDGYDDFDDDGGRTESVEAIPDICSDEREDDPNNPDLVPPDE
jgi:hypothetical protein